MGRGRFVYLSYTALVLLSAVSSASAGLWTVDIDESPAPPPAKGPPFSAHASRNRALLPYQIIGIVGAYVGSVLIVGTLFLTVGRNLRKKAQTIAAQPKEMVKPLPRVMDPSPTSPANSSKSWYSPRKLRQKKSATSSIRSGISNQMSPGMDSVVSFDQTVVEADRARRQEEMERLYAAVMAQDDRKPGSQQNVAAPPPEYSRANPPRLLTDDPALRHLHIPAPGPASPGTPKSPIRAIYPPGSSVPPGPTSPRSPMQADYLNYSFPRETPSDPNLRSTRDARSSSFGSSQGVAPPTPTESTQPKKLRKSLRNLKISSPLMKDDNSDGARTPLSPRFYTDPGIPPEPPTAGTARTTDSQYPPTTPGTARTFGEYGEELDEIRDLPQPNPQRLSTYNYDNPAQRVTNAASTRPDPTKTAPSASGTLPLREMNRQYAEARQGNPSAQAAFPLSPGHWNQPTTPRTAGFGYITSAGPVKTTFVDARRDRLGLAPRTGQATPYSPYMPFTPLTPVTPRLTTRAERKQREKEERKARGVIAEEDAVADEGELWSSGY